MIEKKTVFVLGAGASIYYGYPLGEELIQKILNDMKDEIFVPWDPNNINMPKLESFDTLLDMEVNWYLKDRTDLRKATGDNRIYTCENKHFMLKSIKDFTEMKELEERLLAFNPISIDSFLQYHESCRRAGNIMIAYALLKCEDRSRLDRMSPDVVQKDNLDYRCEIESGRNDWYPHLLHDLLAGCADDPERFLKNNLEIVTFNYDISLDTFLFDKLSKIDIFNNSENNITNHYLNEILKIHHVYGSLGDRNVEKNRISEYGKFSEKNPLEHESHEYSAEFFRFQRFLKSCEIASNIKTMRNSDESLDKKEVEKYRQIFEPAEVIVFIGFGFDRDNLNKIGFPNDLEKWQNICKRSKIKWLNYNNSMKGLSSQFKSVCTSNSHQKGYYDMGRIIESKANNIVDAYQNDFKLFLYE